MTMEIILSILPWMILLPVAMMFFVVWQRERRHDREMQQRQLELETLRVEEENERRKEEAEEARHQRWRKEIREEEAELRNTAGAGSGGYIIVNLPNEQRSLFHDLLKGFEEYARLKGYSVSFSIDAGFTDRMAFKFTLTDPGVVVGIQRVREDFKEYLDRVKNGDPLDDMPVITSIEEHDLLFATLKNRINFLQHSYNLSRNCMEFYEGLMRRASNMPVLPSQNVIVQTGGALSAPNYTALNSPHALIGDANRSDQSIKIADSFNERRIQIESIEHTLHLLRSESSGESSEQAIRNLENVKEELSQENAPDPGRVSRWLEKAKQAIQLGSLGHETAQAVKELFRLFGL